MLGPPHYNPPTIGAAPFGYWERSAGQGEWTFARQNEPSFGPCVSAVACFINCDSSTTAPILNINFTCFMNFFAEGHPIANCDGNTGTPTLNVNDFICFMNKFAAGCP